MLFFISFINILSKYFNSNFAMEKKKPTTPEEGNDDLDELEDEFFEEDDKETPELTKKAEPKEIIPTSEEGDTVPEEEPYEIEEEPDFKLKEASSNPIVIGFSFIFFKFEVVIS